MGTQGILDEQELTLISRRSFGSEAKHGVAGRSTNFRIKATDNLRARLSVVDRGPRQR